MAIQQTFDFLDSNSQQPLGSEQSAGPNSREPKTLAERRKPPGAPTTTPTNRTTRAVPLQNKRPEASAFRFDQRPDSIIDQLRVQAKCIHAASATANNAAISTGLPAIDDLLPGGGLAPTGITEWVSDSDGSGTAALSMITVANSLNQHPSNQHPSNRHLGPLVVVASPEQFFPPAAVSLGIPVNRVIWVRPSRHADAVWAIDQALRSPATAAVWGIIGANLDDRDARRFQLAAETGNTPAALVRPAAVRGRPTFADVRFYVQGEIGHHSSPATSRQQSADQHSSPNKVVRVTLDRCRGGQLGRSVFVSIVPDPASHQHHEKAPLHLATELAQPRTRRRPADRRRA